MRLGTWEGGKEADPRIPELPESLNTNDPLIGPSGHHP